MALVVPAGGVVFWTMLLILAPFVLFFSFFVYAVIGSN
jgi:hypothetical protein